MSPRRHVSGPSGICSGRNGPSGNPARPHEESGPEAAAEQVAALSERLYQAVCDKPGETLGVLAPMVGASPRELQVPAARLKRAGRVRSAGQRQQARYFPMTDEDGEP